MHVGSSCTMFWISLHQVPSLRLVLVPSTFQTKSHHTKKNRIFIKKKTNPKLEHEGISPIHGKREMSCNFCHDINNHDYLIRTTSFPADFHNPSPVCARCHLEKFRDWTRGLHGKRLGGWMQPKIQFHCIDCHHPHLVKFPQMLTTATPLQPSAVIPKIHEPPGDRSH